MESNLPILVVTTGDQDHQLQVAQILSQECGLTLSVAELTQQADLHWLNTDLSPITIDQVRQIQQQVSYHPYQLSQSFFILELIDAASVPAQNALLKILEEPPAHVQLLLTAKNLSQVLPTLQSRCRILTVSDQTELASSDLEEASLLFQQLMTSNYGELVSLSDKYSDRATAQAMLKNLTYWLYQQLGPALRNSPSVQIDPLVEQLNILIKAHQWLNQNVNSKLAVTECFFQLHAKKPILRP